MPSGTLPELKVNLKFRPTSSGPSIRYSFRPSFSRILDDAAWTQQTEQMLRPVLGHLPHRDFRVIVDFFVSYSAAARGHFLAPRGRKVMVCALLTGPAAGGVVDRILQLYSSETDTAGFGGRPASAAAVESLETVVFDEKDMAGGGSQTSCAICLDDFESASELTVMPCRHQFHSGCLKEWLLRSHSCPLCRFSLPVEAVGEEEQLDGQDSIISST
ncbi:E3 ubiquitin-protein ligase [Canna indica]|uniref:RING-type E3 ubiquitin transferase n=1 Tax=Canna indica TaxID=4628 RepID=A0AAQ3L7C0_9LILI|nr:E3 ubiquitin-protein ligase [Canna indica]